MSGDTDVMKLLTKLVNELRSENEMLKGELMKRSMADRMSKGGMSSLSDQISAIESGKVIPR